MARLRPIRRTDSGTTSRLASSDLGPQFDQGAAGDISVPRMAFRSDAASITGSITPASTVVQRNATNEAIEGALRGLPEHYRAAIRWRLWDNLPFAEIGSRLGISDDCAKSFTVVQSAGCANCWGPAMNQVDTTGALSDEKEQARLIALDALLQSAAGPKIALSCQPAPRPGLRPFASASQATRGIRGQR